MSKIIRLHTEGFKRVVAATITPDGRLVRITGENEAGKSSLLDSIEAAFRGGRSIPDVPLHKGKKKGITEIDMGDFVLSRKYTEKGDTLTIELPSGARMGKPQNFMNERLSAISMDPLAFSRADAKAQFDMIKSLVKVDLDFAALKGKNEKDFEARTEVNRQAKAYRAQADGINPPVDTPDELVSVEALVTEMEEAGKHNAEIETRKTRRAEAQADIERQDQIAAAYRTNAVDLRKQADAEDEKAVHHERSVAELRQKVADAPPLPEPKDTAEIQGRVRVASQINAFVESKKRKAELAKLAAAKEAEATSLTEAIAARDKERQDAIAAAKMPVPDLSFGDEVVLYKGVPLAQASTAAKIKISATIAMSMQPEIRVMLIREGSLLDSKALKVIGELAEQYDYQVWIESVDESGKIGFVIEDGRVAGSEETLEDKPAKEEPKPAEGSLL